MGEPGKRVLYVVYLLPSLRLQGIVFVTMAVDLAVSVRILEEERKE